MILAVDVGNSNIVFGINDKDQWLKVWRIQTDPRKTADEYEVIFRSLLISSRICKSKVEQVIFSSVVPSLNREFMNMIPRLLETRLIVVSPDIYDQLPLKILNPYEIGTDLVANAVAAFTRFRKMCMVIDFGTALTFTTISDDGTILGVAIAPGMQTAVKALAINTAQLPYVQLTLPPSVLGENTIHAIQSGVVIGFEGLVNRIIEKTEQELQQEIITIATGGLASVFASLSEKIRFIEDNLTLEGLKIIGSLIP
ncbi:MAG: type III pantothenate kinase [Mangrovibacterium sp.]